MNVAPLPGLDSTVDRAADLLGEAEHLAEAEAGAFAEALGGEERLEHPLHHLGLMPLPVSETRKATYSPARPSGLPSSTLVVRADLERSAVLHRVARVEGEVEERELERAGVGIDRPELVGNLGDQLDVASQRRPKQRRHVGEEMPQGRSA